VAPARSVAFHRVEGRVCDPKSRAAAARQERWTRTGRDRGDGILLESSDGLRINLVGLVVPVVPRVDSPPRRSRAGALATKRAWKKRREALVEHRRRSSSGWDGRDITSGSGDEGLTPRWTGKTAQSRSAVTAGW
jgi:hypothetical protein